MHKWLLILTSLTFNVYAQVGEISELRGNGEVLRADQTNKLLARTSLDILSYDDVRTGNGRLGITFLDSSVIRLTEHSKIIIDEYIFDPNPSKRLTHIKTATDVVASIQRIERKTWGIDDRASSSDLDQILMEIENEEDRRANSGELN